MDDSCNTSSSTDQSTDSVVDLSLSSEDSPSPQVQSLLSHLKQAPVSSVNRKRKVAQNLSRDGKRHKSPRCESDPKGVRPEQRVKEFPNHSLTVSAGKLFCNACREELSLKKSVVELHIKSEKHIAGKERLNMKSKREKDIVEALHEYDKETHPVGETLPIDQRVYRVKVMSTFLRAGVPINKLDCFRGVLEENGYRLAGRHPMSDIIPFILAEEKQRILKEINGRDVSITFDGTSRLGEAMVFVVRFIDDHWSPQQRLVRLQMLAKTMCGEEIARELITTLSTELSISPGRLLASMRDRVASNGVAMRTLKIVYPTLLDIGCFSHTIDHVGERFVTPVLEEFSKCWISLFAHSPHARLLWREKTGRSMATYSETRWWSRWEVLKQVMLYFGDVLPFLQENGIAPANRGKLLAILTDPHRSARLHVELAVVIDVGEHFVRATYSLEGDGALAFSCYETLSAIEAFIQTLHLPNTQAIIRRLSAGNPTSAQQLLQYAKECVEPGLTYFHQKFTEELSASVGAFKSARLFLPHKICEMKPDASVVDSLQAFPFLNDAAVLHSLKQELPMYLAQAADVAKDIEPLNWWKNHASDLPKWSTAARKVALVQPSSAAAERVFSILNSSFRAQQDCSLQDYIECSLMLQYNKH